MWKKCLCSLVVLLTVGNSTAYAERILLIPLDNRPVCHDYVVDTLKSAGVEVVVPPVEMLPNGRQNADVVKMNQWLQKNIQTADAAVIAADTVIYGGLVASRKHDFSQSVLHERVAGLTKLLNGSGTPTYVYSTVMRTPKGPSGRAEPEYYNQYGKQIFQYSALQDKSELTKLSKQEQQQMLELQKALPPKVLQDWQTRRDKNVYVNGLLLQAVQEDKFNYFVLGKDDTAPYSASHRDARRLEGYIKGLPQYKYGHFVGADQLGLLLALRAHNDYTGSLQLVNVVYNKGVGADTIPSYEDGAVGKMVEAHIWALGGVPVRTAARADLVLAVNTPFKGKTLEAGNDLNTATANYNHPKEFVNIMKSLMADGKRVAVADVAYGNGADNALVAQMFQDKIAMQVAAYSGWNTASNTTGYALAQGILSKQMSPEQQKKTLWSRYTDDWAYQANVRMNVYKSTVWPAQINGMDLGKDNKRVQWIVQKSLREFMGSYIDTGVANKLKVTLPWERMFEVHVQVK